MDKEKIDIVHSKVVEGFSQGLSGFIFTHVSKPDFAGNEELLSRDSRFLDSLSNFLLVFIKESIINVVVSELDSICNRLSILSFEFIRA